MAKKKAKTGAKGRRGGVVKKKTLSTKKSKSRRSSGLNMDFISMKNLSNLSVEKRIDTILNKVKEGHIVVLDQALNADEEAKLVTATMHGIKDEFTGIEFCTLEKSTTMWYNMMLRLMSSVLRMDISRPGLTFVGPSYLIKKIKRDPDAFYVSTGGQ